MIIRCASIDDVDYCTYIELRSVEKYSTDSPRSSISSIDVLNLLITPISIRRTLISHK